MPDILEDRRPRGDANASADEHRDLILEDVFRWGTVRSIDAELGHHLSILQGYFVHAHRVKTFQVCGLRGATSQCVTEGSSEVTNLADVNADIGVEGTGGDGERVPLGAGDVGDLEKDPLSCFILHAWFAKLDFHCGFSGD